MPLDIVNPLSVKVDHNFAKIDDAIGFFPRLWHAAKKYSVSNTLPIAAVNTWLQFSLAYVAAIIITSNNLSFITDIFNPTFMPIYTLVSIILLTTFAASSAMRYMHKQKIKEGKKPIEELINDKIRGGKDNEISELAENALKIEIKPNLSFTSHKKASFSIILPISENQKKILDDQRQENKNKAIFLTIPYVISAVIIVGALIQNRLSFANIQDLEWAIVALASIIAIVGICITFSKLKNNEINNNHNIVKKFNNLDILFPFRRGGVVSVIEKKTKDEEENDSISQLIKLLDKHLTDFTDKIVASFDKQLDEVKDLLDNSLLKPANDEIQETLVHLQGIRGDIKKDLDKLHKEISPILSEAKGLVKRASSLNIESIFSSLDNAIKIAEDKVERFEPSRFVGFFKSGESTVSDDPLFIDMLEKQKKEAEKIKKELEEELKKVKDELEELKNKQTQSNEPNSSEGSITATPFDKQRDEEKKAKEKNRLLKSKKRMKELEQENAKLEKELSEQEKMDEWRKKVNGKASDFLYYLLESIKLEEKDKKEEKRELTLRDFDNKIIIYWKDGSQIICHIKKQDGLQIQPSTKVDFVNPDVHAAFKVACAG
ncbi:bZIP transcription factor [Wolbachia endosymbiont (group B) of Aporia crataegi]|uniref:bZIP transcription factor n=1 Tax=Wolbachia endosymbiont (group B) of Aporia crataegi TaxID=2953981 RepID=UPI002226BC79|nr:bZIP transcription factor [Wolbachia endosymbiont (group B) of Aporia crataegi]